MRPPRSGSPRSAARVSPRSRVDRNEQQQGQYGQVRQGDAGEERPRTAPATPRHGAGAGSASHAPVGDGQSHAGGARHARCLAAPVSRRGNVMKLNNISPAAGSRKPRLRVGRGASAGQGKTCGRGVKGQRARKGGYHKVGFEGGQMPIQRRMPKVGFRSKIDQAEVRLDELAKIEGSVIDLDALKKANIIPTFADRAKIVLSGEIKKVVSVKGIGATKGAREAIEKAGGTVEALPEKP